MKNMNKVLLTILILSMITVISGCQKTEEITYKQISQEEAAEMMTKDDGHVIVDVRRMDEYIEGHIPGAICIPNENIDQERPDKLPDLDQIILVYCGSRPGLSGPDNPGLLPQWQPQQAGIGKAGSDGLPQCL